MESSTYRVQIGHFEGPLDLLLHLVKKDELDLFDISIEKITHQYLKYLETLKELDIAVSAEFISMAAHLILMKSRVLLPAHEEILEEDEDDLRWSFIQQLIEYKKFKDASHDLTERRIQREQLFSSQLSLDDVSSEPAQLEDGTVFDLTVAFQNVLKRYTDRTEEGFIRDDVFRVSDQIAFLQQIIPLGSSRRFSDLFPKHDSKQKVIVTFLALLELVKQRVFSFAQEGRFDDLTISHLS